MEVILERYEKQHIIVETKDDDKTKEIEEELKRMGYV